MKVLLAAMITFSVFASYGGTIAKQNSSPTVKDRCEGCHFEQTIESFGCGGYGEHSCS